MVLSFQTMCLGNSGLNCRDVVLISASMLVNGKPYRTIWLADDGRTVEIIDQNVAASPLCNSKAPQAGRGCDGYQNHAGSWRATSGISITAQLFSRQSTSCPLYPRKRTCAVQLGMSGMGQ